MIRIQVENKGTQAMLEQYSAVKNKDYLADKLIEEMAELTQAIIKFRIKQDSTKFSELELEFADVLTHMAILQEAFMLMPSCKNRLIKIEKHLMETSKNAA